MAKAIALSLDKQQIVMHLVELSCTVFIIGIISNFISKEEQQEVPPPQLLSLRDHPEFIDDVISCSAHLLKKMPQAVHRIVPLYTVITETWGPSYIEPSLHLIFKEFHDTALLLQESPDVIPIYQHLYSLVLLLIFLFEV